MAGDAAARASWAFGRDRRRPGTQLMQRSATTRRLSSDGASHALRARRRSRHRAQPLRAARAARPAHAGVTGGRRRPVGIVLGLAATFTVTIVGLAKVDRRRGAAARRRADAGGRRPHRASASSSRCRRWPRAWRRRWRGSSRLGPRGARRRLLVRACSSAPRSGFVYAPCAGPILAAVISVGAASSRTVRVGLAYALGSALVLLALSLGGRALTGRVRAPGADRACSARWAPC